MTDHQCPFSTRSSAILESSPSNFFKWLARVMTSSKCPFSIISSAISLWSTPSNFSKFSMTADQYPFSIRSSAISLWSTPQNLLKFAPTLRQYPFSIRSSAISLWSTPPNFLKFRVTADQYPFSISSFAIFWWLTPLDFSKILSICKSSSSSECDTYSNSNISFSKSSGIFSFAEIYSGLLLSFSSTTLAACLPTSPSWRLAFRTWARSSLYFCWSGVRFLIRGCSGLISGLMCAWLFIFLLITN